MIWPSLLLFDGSQQFRREAGMFFGGWQSNGYRGIAVGRCLSDLIALARFFPEDAVVCPLRGQHLWIYLAKGGRGTPFRGSSVTEL